VAHHNLITIRRTWSRFAIVARESEAKLARIATGWRNRNQFGAFVMNTNTGRAAFSAKSGQQRYCRR
jgi:hypothetical protein